MSLAPRTDGASPDHFRGVALLVGSSVVLSLSGLVFRLMESASAWQIVTYRSSSLCLSILLIVAIRHRGRMVAAFRNIGIVGALGGVALGFGFTGYVFSLTHTTIANAVFVISTAPVLTAVLAWIVLGERVRPATVAALLVALGGVAIMVYDGLGSGGLEGNLAALGVALTSSIYVISVRHNAAVDMVPALAIGAFVATLIGLAVSETPVIGTHDLVLCLLTGGIQTALGFYLFTVGTRYVRAAEVQLILLTEAVLAPLWGWLGVGEVPAMLTFVGAPLILFAVAGLAISGLYAERARKAAPEWRMLDAETIATAPVEPAVRPPTPFAQALEIARRRADAAPVPRPRPAAPRPTPQPRPRPATAAPHPPRVIPAGVGIEGTVRHHLEPVLRQWLDANLRRIVEQQLRREIDALFRRVEDRANPSTGTIDR